MHLQPPPLLEIKLSQFLKVFFLFKCFTAKSSCVFLYFLSWFLRLHLFLILKNHSQVGGTDSSENISGVFLCHFRGHRCYFWGIKLNCFWIAFAFYLLFQHSHTARTVGICFFFIGRVVWWIFFYCHIWAFLRGCVCSEMLADGRCCEGPWVPSVVTWIQNEVKCHPRLWCQGL